MPRLSELAEVLEAADAYRRGLGSGRPLPPCQHIRRRLRSLLADPDMLAEFDRRLALRFGLHPDRVAERVVVTYDPEGFCSLPALCVTAGLDRPSRTVCPVYDFHAVTDALDRRCAYEGSTDLILARVRAWEFSYPGRDATPPAG